MEAHEFYHTSFCPQLIPSDDNITNTAATDHFIVEDLFDFSNDNDNHDPDDDAVIADATFDSVQGNSTEYSSTVTAVDSSISSSFSGYHTTDVHFSSDLPVPDDDVAELEWLSNLTEESFSNEDLQKLQLISGMNVKAGNDDASEMTETREFQHPEQNYRNNPIIFNPRVSVPAKARSKRSRAHRPCNWTSQSRILLLSPTTSSSSSDPDAIFSAPPIIPEKKPAEAPRKKEKDTGDGTGTGGEGRKCLHCATDKTPQWRTGPMGPKTLCNACGVRYKSGRLVPEYRPAASPTFVLTKHSNSHRKVLELRRQKEMLKAHQQQQQQQQFLHQQHHHQNMMFDVSNGDDYLIHQHVGPDFRHCLI